VLGIYARVGNPGMAPVESAHLGWLINSPNVAFLSGGQGASASSARRKSSTGSSPYSHIEPAMSEPPPISPEAYRIDPDLAAPAAEYMISWLPGREVTNGKSISNSSTVRSYSGEEPYRTICGRSVLLL
jgi:hypothetical protein